MALQTILSTTFYLCLMLWTVVNSAKPINWDVKKNFIINCCEQNLHKGNFNNGFKQCFVRKMFQYKDDEKILRNKVIFSECQGDEKCVQHTQQCIKKQQMALHQKLLKKTFKTPKQCGNYHNVLLRLWSKIIERKPCKNYHEKSGNVTRWSTTTKILIHP
ncbi:uncharacterized protein [Centruroides vittatus]|uniref:uncharacterized protein n=1 Tax=Centruroides vittatus TaxID=120091 RepID=UPI00350F5E8B